MDLSIIIINWNSKDYLRECVKSIPQGAKGLDYEILVIDNASYDGVDQMIATEFPHVAFIQTERNLGFSAGNNHAARQAKGKVLLFLNPDTLVKEDALSELVEALRRLPDAGIVGARLLNSDGTLQTCCVQSFPTIASQVLGCEQFLRWFPHARLWGMAALFDESPEPAAVEAVSGACLMVKSELFARLEGFDERYFMYSEDIDLCFRVRGAGLKCYYVPTALVVHHGGGSSQNARNAFANVMIRESVYRFMRLHRGRLRAVSFRLAMGLSALCRLPFVAILSPFRRGIHVGKSPIQKWLSIVRWSLGMEPWAAKH